MIIQAMLAMALLAVASPQPAPSGAVPIHRAPSPAAASAAEPSIAISDEWVRESPPSANATAAYLVIANPGPTALVLQGVTCPLFAEVQMHTVVHDGPVARMTQVPSFTVPAGGSTKFVPGDNHLMLMSPLRPLKAGDAVPLVLDFGPAGKKAVTLRVRGRGAADKPNDHQHHHH